MIPLPPFSTGLLTKAVTWEQANNVSARFPTIVRTRLDSVLNANIINAGATACETIVRRKIKNQQIPLPAHTRRIQAPQNQINDDIAVPEQDTRRPQMLAIHQDSNYVQTMPSPVMIVIS